ncbi:MAG TPA: hypothetical protein PLN76_01130 [Saprospiraceae bacterium]|nr:hypothetical protein [Saprospiraceae bacterium]
MYLVRIVFGRIVSTVTETLKRYENIGYSARLLGLCLVFLMFSCSKTSTDENKIIQISSSLKGDWQLEKVEMNVPASLYDLREDVTDLMLGINPSTLSFNEDTYLLAPGTSIHFIPQNGFWSLIFKEGVYKLELNYGTLQNTIELIDPELPELEDKLLYSFKKPAPECLPDSDNISELIYLYYFTRIK